MALHRTDPGRAVFVRARGAAAALAFATVLPATAPAAAGSPELLGAGSAPTWAADTRSPRPYARSANPVWALCPEPDQALTAVARWVASGASGPADVAPMLHVAGDPHVSARTLVLEAPSLARADIAHRVRAWLGSGQPKGPLRCGFASTSRGQTWRFAAVALEAIADLSPVPVRVRPGTWVDIEARALVPASGAKVVLQTPDGEVHGLPTSFFEGRARARANVDRPGTWVFQVLLDDATGPRPAVEATVFAGVEPSLPVASNTSPAPPAPESADAALALFLLLNQARQERALTALRRDPRLDELARRHAHAMRGAHLLGHDVGDGDPTERLRAASYAARAAGENVAHAGTPVLAHHALWHSPSHRANMLDRTFDVVGIGTSNGEDGSMWVTQLFARAE